MKDCYAARFAGRKRLRCPTTRNPGIQAMAQETPDRPPCLGSMPARHWNSNSNGGVFCPISFQLLDREEKQESNASLILGAK
jgi:hypothetical protein